MKKTLFWASVALVAILAGGKFGTARANEGQFFGHFQFIPNTLVVSRSVYEGTASTVTIGETLPLGCVGGPNGSSNVNVPTTTPGVSISVNVPCGVASDNGEAPNLLDNHNVWNNSGSDSSFGISSPIFLDDLTTDGWPLGTLPVPTDRIVTSFSSKSELALNRSVDGKSLTFMGYHGGPGCGGNPVSPTAPNLIDVSASNTPGVCDPTNPVITSYVGGSPTAYYRAVAEVDAQGRLNVTDGNAYSGDNGRAAMKGANGLFYMAGNDNSGNIPKKSLLTTPAGIDLVNATGAELLMPGVTPPPQPPDIGMIGRLEWLPTDKPGKDTNFRGLTIFNNTLYVSKGSGSNGINSVFQVGSQGTLPTGSAADLATVPITILNGFANTEASTTEVFPFGLFFANANTLYVCDEGDGTFVPPVNGSGNVATQLSQTNGGVQKWSLMNGTWTLLYVMNDGLNIGVQYNVANYPSSIAPATGGCRNMTGRVNGDGTVDIYAITSTVSANGDNGADPNKLVKVRDILKATSLPTSGEGIGHFETIRSARAGEVLRGVAFAPRSDDDDHGFGGQQ